MTDKELLECFRTTLKVYKEALHSACIELSFCTHEPTIQELTKGLLDLAIDDLIKKGEFNKNKLN